MGLFLCSVCLSPVWLAGHADGRGDQAGGGCARASQEGFRCALGQACSLHAPPRVWIPIVSSLCLTLCVCLPSPDYSKIERPAKVFNPLRIPKTLLAELPYKSQPKLDKKRKRPSKDVTKYAHALCAPSSHVFCCSDTTSVFFSCRLLLLLSLCVACV